STRVVDTPARKIQPAAGVIEDEVVVQIEALDGNSVFRGYGDAGTPAVMDDVGEDLDVADLAEPCIDIDALPIDRVNDIVVNLASFARFLDVDTLLVAVVHMIVGNLEIDRASDAQRFMRRLTAARYVGRRQI